MRARSVRRGLLPRRARQSQPELERGDRSDLEVPDWCGSTHCSRTAGGPARLESSNSSSSKPGFQEGEGCAETAPQLPPNLRAALSDPEASDSECDICSSKSWSGNWEYLHCRGASGRECVEEQGRQPPFALRRASRATTRAHAPHAAYGEGSFGERDGVITTMHITGGWVRRGSWGCSGSWLGGVPIRSRAVATRPRAQRR